MAIESLKAVVPPPAVPIQTTGDWRVAEEDLGITFPTDFKDLIRTYGTGEFFGNLIVENPLREWGRLSIRELLNLYRQIRDASKYSFAIFPEAQGMLPWGTDDNGHLYCWWTDGKPDDWKIVQLFHGYEGDDLDVVDGPVTEFLVAFVSNKYPNMLGGNERTSSDRRFTVATPGKRGWWRGRNLGEL